MNRTLARIVLSPLTLTMSLAANAQDRHYKFIDLGTLGGQASYFSNGFDGILNQHGAAVGWADTAIADPFPTFCFNADCLVSHAFVSRNGMQTDLGTLPGGRQQSGDLDQREWDHRWKRTEWRRGSVDSWLGRTPRGSLEERPHYRPRHFERWQRERHRQRQQQGAGSRCRDEYCPRCI
jgi:hypothetical protein